MITTVLALVVLAAPASPSPGGPVSAPAGALTGGDSGTLDWFAGSWEELWREAAAKRRIVLLHFRGASCAESRRLDADTYSDPAVIAATREILCFAIDLETAGGRGLAARYGVSEPPMMLFLEPTGTVRDFVFGYISAPSFLGEFRRILRDEGTVSALRRRLAEDATDLEAHYALARKLRALGDEAGYSEHLAAIRRLDPEEKSLTSRRIALAKLLGQARRSLDPSPLYAFVAREREAVLVYPAWLEIHRLESRLMSRARTAEEKTAHRTRWLAAARRAWELVPPEEIGIVGNNLAWGIYEWRAEVGPADLAFAVELARRAVAVLPLDANVVDTLACCLFAFGNTEEALQLVRRCIELQPNNEEWRKRLADFEGR
ncbi:MAG: hypothetical protein AB1726_13815 [Planctomycetota bacterium]